jgi:arylsulfatase
MKPAVNLRCAMVAALLAVATNPHDAGSAPARPNIVIMLVDNLGYGELGCYAGNRMVETPHIDALAREGLRLTNFNVETSRTPSRCALLTGRYGIRSGVGDDNDNPDGVVQWEITVAELLAGRGYTSALYGKWFLGNRPGRFPTDQGFDEWFGLSACPESAPEDTASCVFAGSRTGGTQAAQPFDSDSGKRFDAEIMDKSVDFVRRNTKTKHPFLLCIPVFGLEPPLYCAPELAGKSGAGPIGDALLQLDADVGRIADAISDAGIASRTILILASGSGPEFREPWRGTAGPWTGNSGTAMEGSVRVPCIIRWPGHIKAGRASNEMVHITDLFTTLAAATGVRVPADRLIDGVNQLDLFNGKQAKSKRESIPIFVREQLYAMKWRDWKLHYVWWPIQTRAPEVGHEVLYNLRSDPAEKHNVYKDNPEILATINQIVTTLWAGVAKEPLIKPGTPDPFQPAKN